VPYDIQSFPRPSQNPPASQVDSPGPGPFQNAAIRSMARSGLARSRTVHRLLGQGKHGRRASSWSPHAAQARAQSGPHWTVNAAQSSAAASHRPVAYLLPRPSTRPRSSRRCECPPRILRKLASWPGLRVPISFSAPESRAFFVHCGSYLCQRTRAISARCRNDSIKAGSPCSCCRALQRSSHWMMTLAFSREASTDHE
jgi:hypothetical protein